MIAIETERLILRAWQEKDRAPFYEMSADPQVMEFFPSLLSPQECDSFIEKVNRFNDENGFCFWACELKTTGEFVGFVGLSKPQYPLPFSPCVEIGWRLARKHWKHGYASEAAAECLKYGFATLGLKEIVSFAVKDNINSIKVMEKIGMKNTYANFLHPKVEKQELKEHVLYNIRV